MESPICCTRPQGQDETVIRSRHLNGKTVQRQTTCRPSCSFDFRLFSTDVTQAYLQSTEKLSRDVYVKPSSEFDLDPNQLLKLLKPLYGLADSGDYWGRTLKHHLEKELGMKASVTDAAFFFKRVKEKLTGLCATYVNDCLQAGTEEFSHQAKCVERKFKCRPRDYDKVQSAGIKIESTLNGFQVHQRHNISKIKKINRDASFKDFRSLRAQLSWATQSRPDVTCAVAQAAQVTEDLFNLDPKKHCKGLNPVVGHILTTTDQALKFPKLDHSRLRLQVYSDASYGNNLDGSSQLGYVIFLADDKDKSQPLFWSSHKSKRVSRSVFGSETMAFADAFDMAFAMKNDFCKMTSLDIPIVMLTDSLSLFDVITKAKITSERRLMIDVKVVKDAYQRYELGPIGFIRSEFNPADALTKVKKSDILNKMLQESVL